MKAAIRAYYSGKAIRLTTQSGIELAVTANHPVLTPESWLRAQFLNEGHYVVKSTLSKAPIMPVDDDHQHMPSLIEQIWGAFSMQPRINARPCTPIMPDDFHGDGRFMDGDIDIVLPYRTLWGNVLDPSEAQALNDGPFHRGLLTEAVLPSDSAGMKVAIGTLPPSNSSMIGRDLGGSLIARHPAPLHSLRLTLGSEIHSLSFESIGDSPTAYPEIMRQLQETFAREVTLDKIIDISEFDFAGHVYDFQTDCGYYLLSSLARQEGIVNSNCRCHLEVFRDGQWQRGVYDA